MTTMKITGAALAAVLAGGSLLAACGSVDPQEPTPASSVSTIPTPTVDPTPTADPTPVSPADLVLAPGAAGPVKVGMSKAAAIATGLLAAGPTGDEGCPSPALVWTKAFADALDVKSLADGEVTSIGVYEKGPKTVDGLGIGSTLADVLAAHPGAKAVEAGYDQTGVLVKDTATDGWIGYLFDARYAEVTDSEPVTFIELTEGEAPSVMRDGC